MLLLVNSFATLCFHLLVEVGGELVFQVVHSTLMLVIGSTVDSVRAWSMSPRTSVLSFYAFSSIALRIPSITNSLRLFATSRAEVVLLLTCSSSLFRNFA